MEKITVETGINDGENWLQAEIGNGVRTTEPNVLIKYDPSFAGTLTILATDGPLLRKRLDEFISVIKNKEYREYEQLYEIHNEFIYGVEIGLIEDQKIARKKATLVNVFAPNAAYLLSNVLRGKDAARVDAGRVRQLARIETLLEEQVY